MIIITEEQLNTIESLANFLRVMAMFEPRLPADIKEAILTRVKDVDDMTVGLEEQIYGDEPATQTTNKAQTGSKE